MFAIYFDFWALLVSLCMHTFSARGEPGNMADGIRLSEDQAQKLQQGIEAISLVFSTRSDQEDRSVIQGSSAGDTKFNSLKNTMC